MWQTGNTASKMLIENYRRFIMAQYQHTEWNPSVWSLHSVHISTQHIICSVLSVPDEDNCHVDGILVGYFQAWRVYAHYMGGLV